MSEWGISLTNDRMFRYEISLDNSPGAYLNIGPIVHIAGISDDVIEFWAPFNPGRESMTRVLILGTGQLIPLDYQHVGTTARTPAGLVWHLFASVEALSE